ncbi:lipopolysaccharide biosynthesis protein [Cyclobacterium salsum]|uniref:lipopolysaccharide biosynthesis protein n=1 Tax=Cyclobacterium salsum TaxID=2666329 RepID=UPI00192EAD8D|nr:lipopolysaccharide biosynthesis protein [Cyclobacterium salsum]
MGARNLFFSGIFYSALGKYSGVILSIIIGAVLARLLTPEEFGIVAILTVFITFFNLLSDIGIAPAIIQSQNLGRDDIQSIFSFSVIIGFLLAIIFYLSSEAIASFYNEPELVNVGHLLSITLIFNTFKIVPQALVVKKLQFKHIGIINVSIQLLSGILAIYLAYTGFSYYALVYKSIFDSVLLFILFYWMAKLNYRFLFKLSSLRKIARFSTFQFMFNIINYFSRNTDNLLIGKFFGPSVLGFYSRSYQLMMMPVSNLTHVITPVLMPIISKFQDDKERIFNSYLKVVKILAIVGFPLSIFLYFAGPEIINIVYGDQWKDSIPIFRLLALTIGIQMVLSSSGSIFQAINRTDLLFYSGTLSAVLMVSGICYGVFIGESLESVGYGLIAAFFVNFFQAFFILVKIALNESLIKFFYALILPVSIGIGFVISLSFLTMICLSSIYLSLFLKMGVSIFTFLFIFNISAENRKLFNFYLRKILIIK